MKSLRVLGLDVALEVLEADSENLGEWEADTSTLRISAFLPPTRRAEVMWHELLHVISSRLALGLSEKLVQRISAAQYAVLRDNPELVRYLQQT